MRAWGAGWSVAGGDGGGALPLLVSRRARYHRIVAMEPGSGQPAGGLDRLGSRAPLDLCAFDYEFLRYRGLSLLQKRAPVWRRRRRPVLAVSEHPPPVDEFRRAGGENPAPARGWTWALSPPAPPTRASCAASGHPPKGASHGRAAHRPQGADLVLRTLSQLVQDRPDLVYVIVGRGRMSRGCASWWSSWHWSRMCASAPS
ncbi:hypothetical protein HS125_10930 [bacterium]|nr:hypothetical protein [bacterium]